MADPKVTIIILSFNRKFALENTLARIYETTTEDERKLIVWDNNSNDGTVEFLGSLVGRKNVRILHSKTNVASSGITRCFKIVDTPYLMALDQDLWICSKNWLKAMTDVMDAEPLLLQVNIGQYTDERSTLWGNKGDVVPPYPVFRTIPNYLDYEAIQKQERIDKTQMKFKRNIAGEVVLIGKTDRTDGCNFLLSGNGSMWRFSAIKDIPWQPSSGIGSDLCSVWPPAALKRTTKWLSGIMLGYTTYHAMGPFWYLIDGKHAWRTKSDMADELYAGKPGDQSSIDERWAFYEKCWKLFGFGRELEDADKVAP